MRYMISYLILMFLVLFFSWFIQDNYDKALGYGLGVLGVIFVAFFIVGELSRPRK
jgi:hypothetical protein